MTLGRHRFYYTPAVLWKCRRPTPKWKKMNKVQSETLQKNMGRGQITLGLWVKERSSRTVTNTPRMHQNSPFWEPKSKNFWGRGHSPLPDTPSPRPTPLGAFGASILAPAALASAPRSSSPPLVLSTNTTLCTRENIKIKAIVDTKKKKNSQPKLFELIKNTSILKLLRLRS